MKRYKIILTIAITKIILICNLVSANGQIKSETQANEYNKLIIEAVLSTKDIPDPNWLETANRFKSSYPNFDVDSIVHIAKIIHYKNDSQNFEKSVFDFLSSYKDRLRAGDTNNHLWKIYKISTDSLILQNACLLMKYAIDNRMDQAMPDAKALYYDTYASLLYKSGKRQLALENELIACTLFSGHELSFHNGEVLTGQLKAEFLGTIFKMERGDQIWKPIPNRVKSSKNDEYYWKIVKEKYLKKHYNEKTSDSLLKYSKVVYYKNDSNWNQYVKNLVDYVQICVPNDPSKTNGYAFDVFEFSNDKNMLKSAAGWLDNLVKDSVDQFYYMYLDTYANLLYKLGRKKEALSWEEKAVALAPEDMKSEYVTNLEKMKIGKPTWKL